MKTMGLNEALMNLCHHMTEIGETSVLSEEIKDLTINDLRIIEAVGVQEPRSMSVIAGKLSVTIGTLTKNMNGLEKRGYVERARSEKDRRVVYVILTESGRKAFYEYREIQRNKIKSALSAFDEDEQRQLFKSVMKLNRRLAGR